MGKVSHWPRLAVATLAATFITYSPLANAYNRLDALGALDKVTSSWPGARTDVWINEMRGTIDGGIQINDPVDLNAAATDEGYFLFILVDSKGATSLFQPPSGSADSWASFSGLAQDEPVGEQFLFSLVSKQPFSSDELGIDPSIGAVTLPRDLASINSLVTSLDRHAGQAPTAVSEPFSYFVDSNTAIKTRGMKLGVKRVANSGSDKPPRKTDPVVPQKPVLVEAPTTPEPVQETVQIAAVVQPSPASSGAVQQSQTAVSSTPSADALRLDIKFEINDSNITPQGKQQLDVLGDALIGQLASDQLPSLLLEGHTDSSGSAAYNLSLSQRRADSVAQYLMDEFDIPARLLQARGRGEESPVDSNATAEGRKNNRRVELKRAL